MYNGFQSLIVMSWEFLLSSPCPVGQDLPLLPEGAQLPSGDHNSLQNAKVLSHAAVNTNV